MEMGGRGGKCVAKCWARQCVWMILGDERSFHKDLGLGGGGGGGEGGG